MSDYIKFTHERATADIAAFSKFAELNACRRKLLELRLIGVDSHGTSFGNLSVRESGTKNFYITSSATGGLPELRLVDCAKVVACDFEKNWLRYEGTAIPSSESLTHAAIYESDATAEAVLHCHRANLWTALLNQAPTTSQTIEYGTPEMAHEIIRLFQSTNVQTRKILVMAGHEGGIVTFGKDLDEAFAVLTRECEQSSAYVDSDLRGRTLRANA
jgi:ribulose-5-phosphate 4-epimerase/fuculose-1-phosphate aldolase